MQERYPSSRARRNNYLPIHPRNPITPGGIQLYTASEPLKKPGYINIRDIYTVHTNMLRAYDWDFPVNEYRLTEASFRDVIRRLGSRLNMLGPASVPQRGHLSLPVQLCPNSSVLDTGTIPYNIVSERSTLVPTANHDLLRSASSSYGTETQLLPTSNHDTRSRISPRYMHQLPRKLISSFVFLLILFIMTCFILGFLWSSL